MSEVWKKIPLLDGYEASSFGRIRRGDKILKHCLSHEGYPRYSVKRGGKNISITGHILVCSAFHGDKPTSKHEVAHFDGTKDNNRPENLRWATRKENSADKFRHGTSSRGEGNGRAKLTEAMIFDARQKFKAGIKGYVLAKEYGVARSTMYKAIAGFDWSHTLAGCEGTLDDGSK